jgi:tetratricopeptide (TPR) repeat protein
MLLQHSVLLPIFGEKELSQFYYKAACQFIDTVHEGDVESTVDLLNLYFWLGLILRSDDKFDEAEDIYNKILNLGSVPPHNTRDSDMTYIWFTRMETNLNCIKSCETSSTYLRELYVCVMWTIRNQTDYD